MLPASHECATVRRPLDRGRNLPCVGVMGYVLLALSGLLLTLAILALVWAPGVIKKTPLDVYTRTLYEGEAAKIDTATNEFIPQAGVRHPGDQGRLRELQRRHVLFVETSCLVVDTGGDQVCVDGDDPNLITADIDIFATDRITALGVDGPEPPARRGRARGPGQQVPLRRREEGLPLLGRPARAPGRDGLRRHRGRSSDSRPTGSSPRSRTRPSRWPKASRVPTPTW